MGARVKTRGSLRWIFLAAALGAGCGGKSLDDASGSSGDAGEDPGGRGGASPAGGASGTATSGSSGTSFGGTSSGGTLPTMGGGTSTGGGSQGGVPTMGGTSFGGTGVGGSAPAGGASGAAGVCSLPIVSGSCQAYFPSFGFSTVDGNCQPFVYGGCEGNGNRFETLAACEAECGGSLSACPARDPSGESCMTGLTCTYDYQGCLCAPKTTPYSCTKIDETCSLPDAGVAEIRVAAYRSCTCVGSEWQCVYR